jgi:two-component system, chemotaxis family, sensor kinase CheA
LDMSKYRQLFLEEGTEHLGEMSRALLELEKDPASGESIDVVFRMAHSIKGMAASLGYDSISEVAHRLEDRMSEIRSAGRVRGPDDLALLFRGLEGLESMLGVVRETGEAPPPDAALAAALGAGEPASAPAAAGSEADRGEPPAKKATAPR